MLLICEGLAHLEHGFWTLALLPFFYWIVCVSEVGWEEEPGNTDLYILGYLAYLSSILGGSVIKNLPANAGDTKRHRFEPWVRKISWRIKWQPTPIFLPVKSHGPQSTWPQRVGHSWVTNTHTHTHTHTHMHTHTHTHMFWPWFLNRAPKTLVVFRMVRALGASFVLIFGIWSQFLTRVPKSHEFPQW